MSAITARRRSDRVRGLVGGDGLIEGGASV
jgi:hypothetical protein